MPWSHGGVPYAALWIVVIAARLAFVYATHHSQSLDNWLNTERLSSDTITDALLGMAVAMVLVRTASLRIRAHRLGGGGSDVRPTTPIPAVPVPAPTAEIGLSVLSSTIEPQQVEAQRPEDDEAGSGLGRLLAFSDSVFAVSITLLVFDLSVRSGLTQSGASHACWASSSPRYSLPL